MRLARFPRIRLARPPTPPEPMPRLSEALGAEVWTKRDDRTGRSTGGDKTRKLELPMAEDTVMTRGATQSNHARQTAAAAARMGMACHVLLEERAGHAEASCSGDGNALLDRLHGATVERHPGGTDRPARMQEAAEARRAEGGSVHVAPGRGSDPTGTPGHVDCAIEAVHQADEAGVAFDWIVHATGSSGAQAGLGAGPAAMSADLPVLGIGTRAPKERQEAVVLSLAERTARRIGAPGAVTADRAEADTDDVGRVCGIPIAGGIEATETFARPEGILLDPVHSAKGAAGPIDLARGGAFGGGRALFLRTGGSVELFGCDFAFGAA